MKMYIHAENPKPQLSHNNPKRQSKQNNMNRLCSKGKP